MIVMAAGHWNNGPGRCGPFPGPLRRRNTINVFGPLVRDARLEGRVVPRSWYLQPDRKSGNRAKGPRFLLLVFRLARTAPPGGAGSVGGAMGRSVRGAVALAGPGALGGDLAKAGEVFRLHLGGGAVLALDRVIHFFAVDADLLGGRDPQTHLVAADVHHGNLDVVTDHDRLIALSRQH